MRPAAFFLALLFTVPAWAAATDSERSAALTETNRALRTAQGDMKSFLSEPARSEDITGGAWLSLNTSDQEDEIVHAMATLSGYGIVFNKRPEYYRDAVQATLETYPDRGSKRLVDLLGGILYDTEPESRSALQKITLKRG